MDDSTHTEEFWSDLLEQAVKNGDEYILMPCAAMKIETVIDLAKRLHISVIIVGEEYAFTTTKEATQALLLQHPNIQNLQ